MNAKFEYSQPKNLEQAAELAQNGMLYAGGTDALGMVKHGLVEPDVLVNLKKLTNLDKIETKPGTETRIGALVKIADIAADSELAKQYPVLTQAAAQVASPQLRNMGTLGGNLCQRPRCWYFRGEFDCMRKGGDLCYAVDGENKYHCVVGGDPCFIVHPSDMATALLALDAKIEIYSSGLTRQVEINKFFVLPEDDILKENILQDGEIVTAVILPAAKANTKSGFIKFKERSAWDFAVCSVAAVLDIGGNQVKNGKIALGGVAPVPWLDDTLNAMLNDLTLSEANIAQLAESALQDADPMQQNGYKVTLAQNLVKRLLTNLVS